MKTLAIVVLGWLAVIGLLAWLWDRLSSKGRARHKHAIEIELAWGDDAIDRARPGE